MCAQDSAVITRIVRPEITSLCVLVHHVIPAIRPCLVVKWTHVNSFTIDDYRVFRQYYIEQTVRKHATQRTPIRIYVFISKLILKYLSCQAMTLYGTYLQPRLSTKHKPYGVSACVLIHAPVRTT